MIPPDRRYAKSHEWVKLAGEVATIGITKFAVEQLTEPTFLELARVGKTVTVDTEIGIIESVKSTSPIYAPVAGNIIEINQAAIDNLTLVNDDPFGTGWLMKIRLEPGANVDHLFDATQYEAQIAGQ